MHLVKVKPREDLKQVIKYYWHTTTQKSNKIKETYHIMGDGAPGIIFQHKNGRSAVLNSDGLPLPISFVYGQNTRLCENKVLENSFVFGINFQPTAFKLLFGINTSEITNVILDTEHFFSRQFNDQILNTSNPQSIIKLFEDQLAEKLNGQRQNHMIDESIHLIWNNLTDIQPKGLYSFFHLSPRQIQRKFKEYTGVSSETYIRIAKFQWAIHLMINRPCDKLSDIGYELNYADQSHFSREFKLFSGFTPKNFIKTLTKSQPFLSRNSSFDPIRIVKKSA